MEHPKYYQKVFKAQEVSSPIGMEMSYSVHGYISKQLGGEKNKQKQWFKHNSFPCTTPLCPGLPTEWLRAELRPLCAPRSSFHPLQPALSSHPSCCCGTCSLLLASLQPHDLLVPFLHELPALLLLGLPPWEPPHTPLRSLSSFSRVFLSSLHSSPSLKSLKWKQLHLEQIHKPNTEPQARTSLWLSPVTRLWSQNYKVLWPDQQSSLFSLQNPRSLQTEKLDGVLQRSWELKIK